MALAELHQRRRCRLADADSLDPHASAAGGPNRVVSASDAIDRFVGEQVRPREARRVSGSDLFVAFERWCQRQWLNPVSAAAFGRAFGGAFGILMQLSSVTSVFPC
jgi:hypothetical protein